MKKLITEMEDCKYCDKGILPNHLVCEHCNGEGIFPTGKKWIVEDYIGFNEKALMEKEKEINNVRNTNT